MPAVAHIRRSALIGDQLTRGLYDMTLLLWIVVDLFSGAIAASLLVLSARANRHFAGPLLSAARSLVAAMFSENVLGRLEVVTRAVNGNGSHSASNVSLYQPERPNDRDTLYSHLVVSPENFVIIRCRYLIAVRVSCLIPAPLTSTQFILSFRRRPLVVSRLSSPALATCMHVLPIPLHYNVPNVQAPHHPSYSPIHHLRAPPYYPQKTYMSRILSLLSQERLSSIIPGRLLSEILVK